MTSPVTVWKSKNPSAMDKYMEERKKVTDAFYAKVDAFKESIGGRNIVGFRSIDGGFSVTGYTLESRSELPAPGWRRDGASNRAVPAKRTPEGKAISEQLKDLYVPAEIYPGSPRFMHTPMDPETGEGYIMSPRAQKIGDDYFLTLPNKPDAKSAAEVDPALWEPAKLSEYHAAQEAQAEVQAA